MATDSLTDASTLTFEAKLPDDITPEEFASLLAAISALDEAIVMQVLAVTQHEPPQLVHPTRRSVVRRVRYGSNFEVVLQFIGPAGAAFA